MLIPLLLVGSSPFETGQASPPRFFPPSCPADSQLATLIASSDLVVIGRMVVPGQQLADEAQKPSPAYLDIPVQIDRVLKGGDSGSATLRFYPRDAQYKPSNAAVRGMSGAPAILFLTHVDGTSGGLYFAGNSPDALRPATQEMIAATRVEASRQTNIILSWQVDPTLPHYDEVRALIASLGSVSGETQQRVFDRLVALGDGAVPAIIAQMDNRRPLQTEAISLANHAPSAFEAVRHYSPRQVVDALDAVLNQITGAGFGTIVNGGSDRQRDATVAGWHVYDADRTCRR